MTKTLGLICVVSVPFTRNYDDAHFSLSVDNRVTVLETAAFLVSGIDTTPWWKPEWRQMVVIKRSGATAVDVIATKPNRGERLILFMTVETDEEELPAKDRLIPSSIFEVYK